MKNFIIMALLVGFCVMNTGCGTLSYYNHTRVKENIIQTRIMASGNQQMINAMNQGADPSDAVKIIPIGDGNVKGAVIAINVFDLKGVKSYFVTYAEAPISSTVTLVGDAASTYYSVKYIADNWFGNDSSSKSSNKTTTGNGNTDVELAGITVGGDLIVNAGNTREETTTN